jgi:hypothetical protein
MPRKKSKLDEATDIVAKIIGEQIQSLPPALAAEKRKELHNLALKVSPSSVPGKPSPRPHMPKHLHEM